MVHENKPRKSNGQKKSEIKSGTVKRTAQPSSKVCFLVDFTLLMPSL